MTASRTTQLHAGADLGRTPWLRITQEQIDRFAQATLDMDPMHVDPTWAAQHSPFGRTVSFGFLTMSLLTYFSHQLTDASALRYALNYGFDRLRLVSAVPVDSLLRAHFVVISLTQRDDGGTLVKLAVTIEIDGAERPALVADWLYVIYPAATA